MQVRSKQWVSKSLLVASVGLCGALLAACQSDGTTVTMRRGIVVKMVAARATDPSQLETARAILEKRVKSLEASETRVRRVGNTILVELRGLKNRQRALDVLNVTGRLEHREVLSALPADTRFSADPPGLPPDPTASGRAGKTCDALVAEYPGEWFWGRVKATEQPELCYALGPNLLSGTSIRSAGESLAGAEWGVDVTFQPGAFANIAANYVGRRVAIVVDDEVISAPVIGEGITGDDVRISGEFTHTEAEALALALRYGALPVAFDQSRQVIEDLP